MRSLSVEDIDLLWLVEGLRERIGDSVEASYLRGRTLLRDTVQELLGCSEYEAEQLVETLELQGFVRFPHYADDTHPSGRRKWVIGRALWTA